MLKLAQTDRQTNQPTDRAKTICFVYINDESGNAAKIPPAMVGTNQPTDQPTDRPTNRQGKNNMSPTTIVGDINITILSTTGIFHKSVTDWRTDDYKTINSIYIQIVTKFDQQSDRPTDRQTNRKTDKVTPI
ncbi:hypothetical protein DPMN_019355 [Dreissena polymorpha]|uniref:Uncharacterized protein n=1 Tax=Dreissena polymorpha TaxID=45954 RepID=A0A9D4NJ37_DREPO|nr:hypothetical protein DPMN_019355 [Dreissena polymorpha]